MAASSPTSRWKLGLFVTVGFATGLAVLGWLSAHRLQRETIEVHYFFDEEVSGLDQGAPVEFRGVQIGKVSRIRAAPDRRHVEVLADIRVDALRDMGLSIDDALGERYAGDEPFLPEMRAQLRSSILTGVTIVQLDFFDPARYPAKGYPFEVPWNTVHTVPSSFKSMEQGLLAMTTQLPQLSEEALATLRALRAQIEEAALAELVSDTGRVMRGLAAQLEELERLELLTGLRSALDAGTGAATELGGLASDLRGEQGLLAGVATPWREAGDILAEALGSSDLPETMRLVRELSLEMAYASEQFALLMAGTRSDMELLRQTLLAVRRLAEILERDPSALLHGRASSPLLPELR